MRFEFATSKDMNELYDLQLRAFESEAEIIGSRNLPALTETFEQFCEDFNKWRVLITRDTNGKIIGAVRFKRINHHIEIGRLMVAQEYRRLGIAIGLMQAVENITQESVFELYTCTKSYININLYEKLGYRSFKEEKGKGDLSYVYMRKTIQR